MTTLDPAATPGPTTPAATPAAALPAALAEPTARIRPSWIALIFGANLGVWMAFLTPLQALLPQQAASVAPLDKENVLALVTGIGALAAVVVNPVAGAFSDRTCPRLFGRDLGRRHVWTVSGAVLGALALMLLSQQHTVAGLVVGWVAAQVCFNATFASLTAAIPDRVPVAQRGAVSGWIGVPQPLGLVAGVTLAGVVGGVVAGYAVISAAVVLMAIPFALFTADDPLPREHRPPFRWRDLAAGMWISPREHPDFAWAWGTRFLVQVGNALGTLYLLFFLTDKVKVTDPVAHLLVLILLYTGGLVVTAVIAGVLSDRVGRRKIFVIWGGIIMAVAALLLALFPVWAMAQVAAALLGAGYGVYLSVDAALITQVLPEATSRGKDLGVINIANSAPQVIAPVVAAPIVVHLGGYPTLYGLTAAVVLLGSVLVGRIRSVA